MSRILVFQHVPFERLGTIEVFLRQAGFRVPYVNFARRPEARPSLDACAGLVVLGGPMNVDETDRYPHLKTEVALIEEAMRRAIPVLGICLGAQLVAKALGTKVYPGTEKEIGWYDLSVSEAARTDPLFAHFRATERVFQWHGDTFDVPTGAVRLASSTICPNQAFRYRDSVYALQFHLEVDEPTIDRWLHVPPNRREIAALKGSIDPDTIRAETTRHMRRLAALGKRTFGAFVKLVRRPMEL
jgi:GMP synthase (glutamine-hydrolysing)